MPMGEAYLASYVRQFGHEAEIFSQDVFHYSEKQLVDYLSTERFDVIGMGFIAAYYEKALKLSQAINSVPDRPFFVLGAHAPSASPEFMLRKMGADAIALGEAELTLAQLLEALEQGSDLKEVRGLAYLEDDKLVTTGAQHLLKDLDALPFPAWDLLPMEHYLAAQWPPASSTDRCVSVFASRGCPYKCNFCYRIDPRWRARSIENVIAEVRELKDRYNANYFHFDDELFAPGRKRMLAFCEALMDADLGIVWDCQGHFKSMDREVLQAMKEAGCKFINVGIESYDQSVLDAMHKGTTREEIRSGLSLMKELGLHAGCNVLWGNIKDSEYSLQTTLELVMEFNSNFQCRTFRPPSPYPGSPLYSYAVRQGLLRDEEDFFSKYSGYDRMTVNFTDIPEYKFYQLLHKANQTLVEIYFQAKAEEMMQGLEAAYFGAGESGKEFRLLSMQDAQ